jgi:hypothetical protein
VRLKPMAYVFVLGPIACGSPQRATIADSGTSVGDAGPPTDAPASSYLDGAMQADAASCFQAVSTVDAAPVGATCLPLAENDSTFSGFSTDEVDISTNDGQCGSGSCLVNHFRGRVSCPYGQDRAGIGPSGTPGCVTPGRCVPVSAANVDPSQGKAVAAQCTDRAAADTVYCSCRCANVDGRTDGAGSYCACPDGLSCVQLVSSIGVNDALSGAYCIKTGTEWDGGSACATSCNPATAPCR